LRTISHAEMLSFWKKGLRNGAIQRLDPVKKGLFSAALYYCRMKGRIFNATLINAVEGIIDRVLSTVGGRIQKKGIEQANKMSTNRKLIGNFPIIVEWLHEKTFTMWLGTNSLNKGNWIF